MKRYWMGIMPIGIKKGNSRGGTHRLPSSTKWLLLGIVSLCVCLALSISSTPVAAQRVSIATVAEDVYRVMPDFPRENQYISTETGNVAESNTLVSRILRYHSITRGRPLNYRLDWKFTLADYLGANERIAPTTYPGADTLRTSPLARDTEIIRQLNRAQRETLITNILLALGVDPNTAQSAPSPQPTPTPSATPRPPTTPPIPGRGGSDRLPNEPRPGDAQLLMP